MFICLFELFRYLLEENGQDTSSLCVRDRYLSWFASQLDGHSGLLEQEEEDEVCNLSHFVIYCISSEKVPGLSYMCVDSVR